MRLDHNFHLRSLGVITQGAQSLGGIIKIFIPVPTRTAINTNRITAKLRSAIHPTLVLINRTGTRLGVPRIELVPGVDENQHVLHAFTRRALDQFPNVGFIDVLAFEGTVPILDMRDTELVLGQRGIVEVSKLSAAEPSLKGVFLDADLEPIRIVLILGQQRGGE